jgi:hypothetical protein
MANNIQIIGNILNTSTVNRYNNEDTQLLVSQELKEYFGEENDYIEYYIYDIAGNLLNINYNYKNFKLPTSSTLTPGSTTLSNNNNNIQTTDIGITSNINNQSKTLFPIIEIDPILDIQNTGYTSGEFRVQYNFFKNKISSPSAEFFIKEISPDRTELSIVSLILTNDEIETTFNSLVDEINNSSYFVDYLLNIGLNQQFLTVNIALNKLSTGYEILFKLYDPLPSSIQEKTSLWVVDEKVEPYIFDINLDTIILPVPSLKLRGPDFNISIPEQGTLSTTYQNYDTLVNNIQSIQDSSYNKILNLLSTQSIDINVDYTNFSNFIFFGSAVKRIENFKTKIQDLENYNNIITNYTPFTGSNPSLLNEINVASFNINDIISKFDGFEYYMYFESSSYAWPKSSSTLPYILYPSTSSQVNTWYNNYINSATIFDSNNVNNLETSIPVYILEDQNNAQYLLFLNMIGQYFDNIWIFLKSITDINDANNNLEQGVSKDLVYHVLKSYGIKLYNTQGNEDLDQFLIGSNTGSANFDNDFSPTGSYLNNIPRKDLLSEIYKRIYHNLPYLSKNKGTVAGVEALITTFGITGSILNVKEYGGSTKSELLKGYSNNKVRTVNNDTTGSVLSILTNVYQLPTSSDDIRDNDLHYVDVSFSPQNQIDTYLSSSIATNNPSFSLDDYIGDPRQLYSGSYEDLIEQNKIYSAPFMAEYMDYNGFIRLIQFFDNSLFKMIEDFIPARASLSTGVTINSTILERNKISYANPSFTTSSILNANYEAPELTPQYGKLYESLPGDKSDYFTGEFSGSGVDLYNKYFIPTNFNPYLQLTASNNINTFKNSDFNVLLNNVSSSLQSLTRRNIEYKIGNTGSLTNRSITTPAQLQDSYESLTSYNKSRYDGVQLYSQLYNIYTSASNNYGGDISFGKTAAIDHYVKKLGLFTQVEISKFLPRRNDVSMVYLVDEFGNYTNLDESNNNWEELQNTFKNGFSTIALFDSKQYSNQKITNGPKLIFDSGYSYNPILYFSGSGDNTLYFENLAGSSAFYAKAQNFNTSSYNISGSSVLGFPLIPSSSVYLVSNLFNEVVEGSQYFSPGGSTINNLPSYSVQETADHRINATFNFNLEINLDVANSQTWALEAWVTGSTRNELLFSDSKTFDAINIYTGSFITTVTYISNFSGEYAQVDIQLFDEVNLVSVLAPSDISINGLIDFYNTDNEFILGSSEALPPIIISSGTSIGSTTFSWKSGATKWQYSDISLFRLTYTDNTGTYSENSNFPITATYDNSIYRFIFPQPNPPNDVYYSIINAPLI